MLIEVISNYTREAGNTVKMKMFKVKVSSFGFGMQLKCVYSHDMDDCR